MAMRKFFAASVEDALAQIQRELGDDAVILDTRAVQERDNQPFDGVEVWVQEPDAQPVPAVVSTPPQPAPAMPPPPVPTADYTPTPTTESLTAELHQLRAQMQAVHAQFDTVVQRMAWLGADAGVAHDDLGGAMATSLATRLPFSGGIRVAGLTRVALIGPSGAGKTTHILKLAYHLTQQQGLTVGIIAADTLRIGAREQIGRSGAALGLPVVYAYDADAIDAAATSLRDCAVLLLDTPGVNPRHPQECMWLERLLTAFDPAEVHLVLPAGLTGTGLRTMLRAYAPYEPSHLLLTKLDEMACLSESAPVILESGLILSYLGVGAAIMDDLRIAGTEECARYLRAE